MRDIGSGVPRVGFLYPLSRTLSTDVENTIFADVCCDRVRKHTGFIFHWIFARPSVSIFSFLPSLTSSLSFYLFFFLSSADGLSRVLFTVFESEKYEAIRQHEYSRCRVPGNFRAAPFLPVTLLVVMLYPRHVAAHRHQARANKIFSNSLVDEIRFDIDGDPRTDWKSKFVSRN